ncbi:hypothetical protein Tco_0530797 [Tanacetum coccineum]
MGGSTNTFEHTPKLAIYAAAMMLLVLDDAANEDNAATMKQLVSAAESHLTEWVVPNPVSPVTDWRPWPYVPVHSPIRDPTPEPVSLPTPPAQTFIFKEPLSDNYLEPETYDNIITMEADTLMVNHLESPVRPDDAPTPTVELLEGKALLY